MRVPHEIWFRDLHKQIDERNEVRGKIHNLVRMIILPRHPMSFQASLELKILSWSQSGRKVEGIDIFIIWQPNSEWIRKISLRDPLNKYFLFFIAHIQSKIYLSFTKIHSILSLSFLIIFLIRFHFVTITVAAFFCLTHTPDSTLVICNASKNWILTLAMSLGSLKLHAI